MEYLAWTALIAPHVWPVANDWCMLVQISPLFSLGGEAKYVEHGEQAQRSNGGSIACFDRQLVRNAG